MNNLKKKVSEEIKKIEWDDYKELVKRLILSACEDGDEEVITGTLHEDKVKGLIEELNHNDKYGLKISKRKDNFEVGIILSKGKRKVDAIQGALKGRWINVLITDRFTAEKLL